jgi:hypothetical protein
MAKAPDPTSTKKPAKVPLHAVMDVLRTIHDNGDSDHFMNAAENAGATVTIHPQTIDFVKKYIADNNLQGHPATQKVVVCPHPHHCPPASSGE